MKINNNKPIDEAGYYARSYASRIDLTLPAKDIKALLNTEAEDNKKNSGSKPFQIADPTPVDLNIAKTAKWVNDATHAYARYTILLSGALSASINFDQFYLPRGTEMYIYNEKGNMITGPITEAENNTDKAWGSWVYKGEYLTVEIKTPLATKDELLLHASNVAYGYKPVYKTLQPDNSEAARSATCNINVLCPLGSGWENERNAVTLILNGNGAAWCSGAMIMNTCNTTRPFILTADHCFDGNIANWRYTFLNYHTSCTSNQTGSTLTFNGSALRARSAATDFMLTEMNQTPSINSGISYAGWSRNTNGITQGTIIHHPGGDVMKISRDNDAPVAVIHPNIAALSCWRLNIDAGATESGSSGGPYFDQNRRIIAQHFGISTAQLSLPVCDQVSKFGGRFDLSWAGGGTNETRLSNWLDPLGTGAQTTNTTNISSLIGALGLTINGPASICNSPTTYSLTGAPAGSTITWANANAGFANISPSGSSMTLIPTGRGFVTITATVSFGGTCAAQSISRTISVNAPVSITSGLQGGCNGSFQPWLLTASPTSNGSNWNWTVGTTGTNSQIIIYTPNSPSAQISVRGGGTVRLNYTDACGIARQDGVTVFSSCPQFRLAVSPNPAKNNLNVSLAAITDQDKTAEETETAATSFRPKRVVRSKGQTVLSLYEMNTTLPVKQWRFNDTKNPQYNLPLQGLRKGVYILQVDRDNETRLTKVIIE